MCSHPWWCDVFDVSQNKQGRFLPRLGFAKPCSGVPALWASKPARKKTQHGSTGKRHGMEWKRAQRHFGGEAFKTGEASKLVKSPQSNSIISLHFPLLHSNILPLHRLANHLHTAHHSSPHCSTPSSTLITASFNAVAFITTPLIGTSVTTHAYIFNLRVLEEVSQKSFNFISSISIPLNCFVFNTSSCIFEGLLAENAYLRHSGY